NGSLNAAGFTAGDVIRTMDGEAVANAAALRAVLERKRAGDVIQAAYETRGGTRQAAVTLVENPALEAVPYEAAGMRVTPEMRAFRQSWLGSGARQ
ncbi:MAG TPA: hypothetical protein VIB55_20715, partial [Longimicrobium sp.]